MLENKFGGVAGSVDFVGIFGIKKNLIDSYSKEEKVWGKKR